MSGRTEGGERRTLRSTAYRPHPRPSRVALLLHLSFDRLRMMEEGCYRCIHLSKKSHHNKPLAFALQMAANW